MGALKLPMSQVLSNTSLELFYGTKTWGSCAPLIFLKTVRTVKYPSYGASLSTLTSCSEETRGQQSDGHPVQ